MESRDPLLQRVGFVYQMDQDALSVTREGGYTRLMLDGALREGTAGAPEMPFLVVHIAIPEGAKVAGVSVVDSAGKELEGQHVVMPAQPPRVADLRLTQEQLRSRYADARQTKSAPVAEEAPAFVPPRPDYYKRGTLFPAGVAHQLGERNFGPYRVLALRVNPVQYLPVKGMVTLNQSFTLAVDFTKPARQAPQRPNMGAEQLEYCYELASRLVLNPEDLFRPEGYKAPGGLAAYLIITNRAMRPEFDRLAEWKTTTGMASRVVTIEDIVGKVYGDFSVGAGGAARDTQEIIRNFLKWARNTWQVCYLLIGGDVDVIPVREVAALSHYNWYTQDGSSATPLENRCYYDATRAQVNLHLKDAITATTPLLGITSGKRIPHNPAATATSAGWYFATSPSYSIQSGAPTKYVVIKGDNDPAGYYRIDATYSIPTDLYYGSLAAPTYDQAGQHDWDALGNGLYGYYAETGNPSGIDFHSDICVGRVPCSGQAQAKAVVDKLIKYEMYDGMADITTRKAVFGADYWGGPVVVSAAPAGAASAGENQYLLTDATTCKIALKDVPGLATDLIAEDTAAIFRSLPYNRHASPVSPGWYFALGPATLDPSGFEFFGIDLRIPTKWIVVRGPAGTLSPDSYWVDSSAPDGAVTEKEAVRAVFRAQAPQVDLHSRYYRDFFSTPSAAAGDTVSTNMLTTAGLAGAVGEGAAFVSLSGHGWSGGCCLLGKPEADSAANGMNLPVVYADSCSTGNFQDDDAFSEKLLLNPSGGAIAYLGNTRYSWIGLGDDMERLFWDALFTPTGTAHLATGFYARFAVLAGAGWPVLWKWCILAMNLQGDPAMRPWAGVPQRMVVRAPSRSTPLTILPVSVVDARGGAVAGAKVCVYQKGKLMRVAYTNVSGQAMLSLAGAVRGTVMVTATRPGAVPAQQPVVLV